mgnify:CR=1 FL=1|tara:strand:+ start:10407 stop:11057 length:651 start_codon:yes stop_codon:yes gene_type:complete
MTYFNQVGNFSLSLIGGEVIFDAIDGQTTNMVILDIKYKGVFKGISNLDKNFIISTNSNRIIIVRTAKTAFPQNLFSYEGTFEILKADGYNVNGNKMLAKRINNWHYWDTVRNDNWENLNSNFKDYRESRYYSSVENDKPFNLKWTNIIQVGLDTSGETSLLTSDGNVYEGKYHIHSFGNKYMTGVNHDENSKPLFYKKKKIIKKRVFRAKQLRRR